MNARLALVLAVLAVMVLPTFAPLAKAFQPLPAGNQYNFTANALGVLPEDRMDYMNSPYAVFPATNGTARSDIANYLFQGGAGYMSNMSVWTTSLGTIYFTYDNTYWFEYLPEPPPTLGLLGVSVPSPQVPPKGAPFEPIEGWYLGFDIHPPEIGHFQGVFVATYSGFDTDNIAVNPKVIFNATNGRYFRLAGTRYEVLANTSRLMVVKYDINLTARSLGDAENRIDVNFTVHVIISFNKATKYITINQYVDYTLHTACCSVVPVELYFGRIAAIDADHTGCRSFYGWNNITLPRCGCNNATSNVFLLLSWVNSTLDSDFFTPLAGGRAFAVYMAAYPYNEYFNFAISSIKYDPSVSIVWRALDINGNYARLDFSSHDNDTQPDGDLALVRFQWHISRVHTIPAGGNLVYNVTPKVTVVYGIYDINASSFDGGAGGPFNSTVTVTYPTTIGSSSFSTATLTSNVTDINGNPMPSITTHTIGELAYLETGNTSLLSEANLTKIVNNIDLNGDGGISSADNETAVPVTWMPIEELSYQLYNEFQGPCFNKLAAFGNADFLVLPVTANPMDPAAAAWLQGVLQAQMVLYDIQATDVFVGAAAGPAAAANDLMPFLALPLQSLSSATPVYEAASKFAASDGRILLQMAANGSIAATPWRDNQYLVVTVAGWNPNYVTRYFSDFASVAFGGQITSIAPGAITRTFASLDKMVMAKYYGMSGLKLVIPSLGLTLGEPGIAVIAIAKDHFNNTGLMVYGWSASDTYWAAYWFARNYNTLVNGTLCGTSAVVLRITYKVTYENGTTIADPIATATAGNADFNLVRPASTITSLDNAIVSQVVPPASNVMPSITILYRTSGPDVCSASGMLPTSLWG